MYFSCEFHSTPFHLALLLHGVILCILCRFYCRTIHTAVTNPQTAGLLRLLHIAWRYILMFLLVARLRDEILTTVGSSGTPNYGDVRNMEYLQAVLNE